MIYASLLLMAILFIETSTLLGVMPTAHAILLTSRCAIEKLSSSVLDDAEKEIAARQSSLVILKHTFLFVLKFSTVSALLLVIYFILIYFTDVSPKEFANTAFSWVALLGLTIFAFAYMKIRNVHRG